MNKKKKKSLTEGVGRFQSRRLLEAGSTLREQPDVAQLSPELCWAQSRRLCETNRRKCPAVFP